MKVFVYGTLKKGHGNHRFLEGAKFVGLASLEGSHVLLDAGFPVCIPFYSGKSVVTGEVYEVTPEQMKHLDRLEGEGRMYHRRKRKVRYATGRGNAWVYIGDRQFWKGCPIASRWLDENGIWTFERKRQLPSLSRQMDEIVRQHGGVSPDL